MKKLITLLLAVAGMVSTASATDYYVTGVADVIYGSAWVTNNNDNKMTSNGDGSYQLVVENKELDYGNYEYKITEGAWGNGEFPSSGNYTLNITLPGKYKITYVYTPGDTPTLTATAEMTSTIASSKDIYLRSNKDWNHNNDYKFVMTDGEYNLSVNVSDISEIFYYRFHIDTWGDDLCPNNSNNNHYEISSGLLPKYEMYFAGGYSHANNSDASNFKLPLNTKPLGKIDLTLKIYNDKMVLSMQGYEQVTPNASGFCTFVNHYPLTIPASTAYYATDDNDGTATAHAITNPAANTPMLIKGDASTSYYFTVASTGESYSSTNAFHAGSDANLGASTDGGYNYILKGDQFYLANDNYVASNKAYLKLSVAAKGRILKFFGDEETGINAVSSSMANSDACYSLSGQRIANPAKGLYIRSGKKVIVK